MTDSTPATAAAPKGCPQCHRRFLIVPYRGRRRHCLRCGAAWIEA